MEFQKEKSRCGTLYISFIRTCVIFMLSSKMFEKRFPSASTLFTIPHRMPKCECFLSPARVDCRLDDDTKEGTGCCQLPGFSFSLWRGSSQHKNCPSGCHEQLQVELKPVGIKSQHFLLCLLCCFCRYALYNRRWNADDSHRIEVVIFIVYGERKCRGMKRRRYEALLNDINRWYYNFYAV